MRVAFRLDNTTQSQVFSRSKKQTNSMKCLSKNALNNFTISWKFDYNVIFKYAWFLIVYLHILLFMGRLLSLFWAQWFRFAWAGLNADALSLNSVTKARTVENKVKWGREIKTSRSVASYRLVRIDCKIILVVHVNFVLCKRWMVSLVLLQFVWDFEVL